VAAVLSLLCSMPGCMLWQGDRWNFDTFRDQRAVDIDHRLTGPAPIVKNPF